MCACVCALRRGRTFASWERDGPCCLPGRTGGFICLLPSRSNELTPSRRGTEKSFRRAGTSDLTLVACLAKAHELVFLGMKENDGYGTNEANSRTKEI